MDKNIKASITVEASFCVPIFFLVLFSLLYEFNILFGINENYAKSQIGKTLRVLFEKEDHGYYVGHGDNYLLIKVQSDEQLIGQLKNVIINSYDEMLIGRVV